MKKRHSIGLAVLAFVWLSAPLVGAGQATQASADSGSTADHSKFEGLQRTFDSGPDVTRACLECHTEAAHQIHKTKHWTWRYTNPETGQELGKSRIINNFCTATTSNMTFCAACHIGYDYADEEFDFASQEKVDCVVCHDTTGSYKKIPGLSGHPTYAKMEWPPHSGRFIEPPDLTKIAQSVGKTSRQSCGSCHFFGGGGNGVKHGDLDSSLTNPKRYLDVHMDSDGLDFSCTDCHMTLNHEVPGSRYNPTAKETEGVLIRRAGEERNPATCRSCHGTAPHSTQRLNTHARRIACETCHIPEFARGGIATKMIWDWSTAGSLNDDGKPFKVTGSEGRTNYDSKKGSFVWESSVIPEYAWFNGRVDYTLFGDSIDPDGVVQINSFSGAADDGESRIWPVKVMRGKQPYDAGLNTLAVVHTAGEDGTAYWTNFDWDEALRTGMRARGVEYSGKFGFVETEMRWPITHMVAPKEDALRCKQCHTAEGRLEGIDGIYLPGRDANPLLDKLGFSLALLTLVGVLLHGLGRLIAARRRG